MTTTAAVFFIFRLFIFLFCFVLLLLSFYLSFLFFLSPTIIYEDKRNRKRKKKYFEKKKIWKSYWYSPPLPFIAGCWRINKKKQNEDLYKTKDKRRRLVMKIWSTATAARYDEWRKGTWANSRDRWAEQNNEFGSKNRKGF